MVPVEMPQSPVVFNQQPAIGKPIVNRQSTIVNHFCFNTTFPSPTMK
jgi:hypothetical protein